MRRRQFLKLAPLSLPTLSGCFKTIDQKRAEYGGRPLTAKEHEVRERFAEVGSVDIRIDAFGEKSFVNIFDHSMSLFNKTGALGNRRSSQFLYGSPYYLPIPIRLRARWRDHAGRRPKPKDSPIDDFESRNPRAYYGGNILGDFSADVADRIPQALIDDFPHYRKFGMSLRLKIRLHDQGLLIGWHVGNIFERVHVGGDFEERHPIRVAIGNGRNTEKSFHDGWYIHPVTKERITINF